MAFISLIKSWAMVRSMSCSCRASSIVKNLIAGAGLQFEDRGVHMLKGVSGEGRLFNAASG